MASDIVIPPEEGKKITISEDGVLSVPDHPMVTFVEGEDVDVWPAVQQLLDKAVAKVYAGKRQVVWIKPEQDVPELLHGTAKDQIVGLNLSQHSLSACSVVFSAMLMFRHLGWDEVADLLYRTTFDTIQGQEVPLDSELLGMGQFVTKNVFFDIMIDFIDTDEEAKQYDELADTFHKEFETGAEKTAEFAQKAMEKAREQLTLAGKFTEEQGHRLKVFLENDFSRVSQEMTAGAKEKLNPARLGAGALSSMSKLLHKTGVALSGFADKADDALACKSGEITSAGKLKCNACEYEINFKKTGRIPPCPKCHKTEFTKGY